MNSEFLVATHALVFLNHRAQVLRSEDIAENVCTNPARIRKIMSMLKKAGLVQTKMGRQSRGYCFQLDPAEVNLRQVYEAVSDKVVCASWRSGDKDMECLVASGIADIMDGILDDLDSACKARLQSITIKDIDDRIFSGRLHD